MKTWKKRLLISFVAAFFITLLTALAITNAAYLPPPIGRQVWTFGYRHLSLAPQNNEPYGVYIDKPFGPTDDIVVAFYDGYENHLLVFHPGGDDHRLAAMQPIFHLRVNAPNDKEAARYLHEFFAKKAFKGSIRMAQIFAHGAPARPMLGRSRLESNLFGLLSEYRPKEGHANLAFISCNVAQGDAGRNYIQHLADEYGLRVTASEKTVSWYVTSKWFKGDEGKPNYEVEKQNWLTANPPRDEAKEIFGGFHRVNRRS